MKRIEQPGSRLHAIVIMLTTLSLLIAGCGSDEPTGPTTGDTAAGAVIDWSDPAAVTDLGDGWSIRHCEGDGPFWCIDDDGAPVGAIEVLHFPAGSFDSFDPARPVTDNLEAMADGYHAAIGADRVALCGPDYAFEPIEAAPFVFRDTVGVSYGFIGSHTDGRPAEISLQYATLSGDSIVIVAAAAHDDGGCPGRDDQSNFDSASLEALRPRLEAALRASTPPS